MRRFFAAFALVLGLADASAAEPCRRETFEQAGYIVCSFDLAKDDLRMLWRDSGGAPYKTFEAAADALKAEGLTLAFAMNAGMYDENFAPVGLYIEDGKTLHPANTRTVSGSPAQVPNFYKKPNGIFYLGDRRAGIVTTDAWVAAPPQARFATQSGPMLVIDGEIHPAFIEGSTDVKPRDGVGLSSPTEVHFVIGDGLINFHDFARFFRDRLGCRNALFLDGGWAPGLYAPELQRSDPPGHGGYGPMIAAVTKR